MKYLGVIGHPLENSLSPVFQQAALDHLRLDIVYEAWPTPPEGLATRITGLRAPSVLGANVTIPHKETVMPLIDEPDEIVRRIGAVNTVVNRDGRLHGFNTDSHGFLRAIREDAGFEPRGRRAVVVGAGGAARAVIIALLGSGVASVTVINRTFDRAVNLVRELRNAGADPVGAMPDDRQSWEYAMSVSSLLVNCTPVGSTGDGEEHEIPVPIEFIHSGQLVYDLVYYPLETPLIKSARKRGASVIGGLPMLVYQGARSFELWTGQEAPLDIMFKAAANALAASALKGEG